TPPPWLGVVATDPLSTAPVEGVGLLRFVDLASVWTVAAIETRDLGEVLPDGRVVLHGRLEGDQPRGCSLTVEEVRMRRGLEDGAATVMPVRRTAVASPEQLPFVVSPASPPPAPAAADAQRIPRVMRALKRLRAVDLNGASMGLHLDNARAALEQAVSAVTASGLARELATPGIRPESVSIVVPWGVFTTPIEWTALYAAAGASVHLKAPTRDPAFCQVLAQQFSAEGLAVSVGTNRDLGAPDAVVAFGDDETVAAVAAATPGARHALFGHRFSVALVDDGPTTAERLARDHLLYDTRGCMAPAAVFVVGDGEALFRALPEALDRVSQSLPAGSPAPALGPEIRRRMGLARACGQARCGVGWKVAMLPAQHFHPVALPRLITIHPVADAASLARALAPWQDHLSALSTDDWQRPWRDEGAWLELY
ncbi:MAG: acyl-CoA reductase, partial [Myxococcota bacterium]|nr:acyl-CoA reductase [Myxococcota bacterium]